MSSTKVECAHCGAAMNRGSECPVCQFPDGLPNATAAVASPQAKERTHRPAWWAGGRAELLAATGLFLLSFVVPLTTVQRVHNLGGRVSVSALQMATSEGPYGRELKSAVVLAIPGAALALLSFLYSRRTREAMVSTRPLVFVVSVLPLVAAGLPLARLERLQLFDYHAGPGLFLAGLGAVCGLVGAVRFGNGIPSRTTASHHHDDDDQDD